jgi:transposase-like protein
MAQNALVCPFCGSSVSTPPFKMWQFGSYKVGRYKCKKCEAKFNFYRGPKASYTIPKGK